MRLALVEVETYAAGAPLWRRLSNMAYRCTIAGQRVQYEPRLQGNPTITTTMGVGAYCRRSRDMVSVSDIKFVLSPEIYDWMDAVWIGRPIRILSGVSDIVPYDETVIESVGKVSAVATGEDGVVTIQATDLGASLDVALSTQVYPDTAAETVRGRPVPWQRGRTFSVEPVCEDTAARVYRVGTSNTDTLGVRVGGLDRTKVTGVPTTGQFQADLPNARFALGSDANSDVRADAAAPGWETYTTADLLKDVVTEVINANPLATEDGDPVRTEDGLLIVGDYEPDAVSMAPLDGLRAAAPWPVGYFAKDSVNRLDVLDEAVAGVHGWWSVRPDGRFVAGILRAPGATPAKRLDKTTVQSAPLKEIIPPAWRIRVEHSRNWSPATNLLEGLTDTAARSAQSAAGQVAEPYQDASVTLAQPRAEDLPLIRSFVNDAAAAIAVRDLYTAMWGVERRVYTVKEVTETPLSLDEDAFLDFESVHRPVKVWSRTITVGGSDVTYEVVG
ncbi:hypothetical protein [Azospirillum tabaci]|uniref:hypothetical protein n=1 Tax=Azospirillum tabaci TaxID=2752310 RepID=UPI0016615752|nr:hypothetical protein [Azospirillum tabaci]